MQDSARDEIKPFISSEPSARGRTLDRKRAHKQWHEDVGDLLFMPLRLLASLPFIADGARLEARQITVERNVIELSPLPAAFDGLTIAFLTDLHCSPETPPDFLERVVQETNRLKPDVVLLGGDYVTRGVKYLQPVAEVLRCLRAPMGVYGVLGNHDYWSDSSVVRSGLHHAGVVDITNSGRWLRRGESRLRVAGVGDLWEDTQDLPAALDGANRGDAVILLSHNPDYAMHLSDPRVRLVLAGHTHGGQIILPHIGAMVTNSKYGRRLVSGLISFDRFQLYVSRGIGSVVVPLRYHCPPEVTLLTLKRSQTN